jgi:hypothetical protein
MRVERRGKRRETIERKRRWIRRMKWEDDRREKIRLSMIGRGNRRELR